MRTIAAVLFLVGCVQTHHVVGTPCGVPGQTTCSGNFVQVCTSGGWRDVDDCSRFRLSCGLVFEQGREIYACKER